MQDWAAAHLSPVEFWVQTPREVLLVLRGTMRRRNEDLRNAQALAYSQACLSGTAFNNPKAFPTFADAFPDNKPKQQMTPDQIMQSMQMWAAISR